MSARSEILDWYRSHGRSLPWRQTRDPYRILVSEIMLQQTQVERVVGFYERFLILFPDAATLARAPLETVHRAWKGLGYPSRAERLQAACQVVVAAGGRWPSTPEDLQTLPGIGPYTGGSVACFAFGLPVAVVDTNVARVYARREGLRAPFDRRRLTALSAQEVDPDEPIAYTNALMDLGAMVCRARDPDCPRCPWSGRCQSRSYPALIQGSATPLKVASPVRCYQPDPSIPVRGPKVRIVLGLVHHEGRYLVARRPRDVHQGGLWEVPGGKREPGEDDRTALARELTEEIGGELLAARPLLRFDHSYPDRVLAFHCYRCRLFNPGAVRPLASQELRWVTPREFMDLPFPPANGPLMERLRRYHRLDRVVTAARPGR